MAKIPQNGRSNPRINQAQEVRTYGGRKTVSQNGRDNPRLDQEQEVRTYGGRKAVAPGARIAQEQTVVKDGRGRRG